MYVNRLKIPLNIILVSKGDQSVLKFFTPFIECSQKEAYVEFFVHIDQPFVTL